jgi:hypothetical protein
MWVIELDGKIIETKVHKGCSIYKRTQHIEVRFEDGEYKVYAMCGGMVKDFWVTTSEAVAKDISYGFKQAYINGRKLTRKLNSDTWLHT